MASKKAVADVQENVPMEKAKTVKKAGVKKEVASVKAVKKAATVEKTEETVQSVAAIVKPVKIKKSENTVKIDVVDTAGKVVETISLPAEMFGAPINKTLMAQAVRVYLANQRQGTSRTKSRGEVRGSTRKIYRQKGTGRARHGGIRAPIFVGGGVAHGPKQRDHSMSLPKKMRKAALFSALTSKMTDNQIKIVSGLEKIAPKTKEISQVIAGLKLGEKKYSVLLLTDNNVGVTRAARNLPGVTLLPANQVNTYEVLQATTIVFMKDAINMLEKNFAEEK